MAPSLASRMARGAWSFRPYLARLCSLRTTAEGNLQDVPASHSDGTPLSALGRQSGVSAVSGLTQPGVSAGSTHVRIATRAWRWKGQPSVSSRSAFAAFSVRVARP